MKHRDLDLGLAPERPDSGDASRLSPIHARAALVGLASFALVHCGGTSARPDVAATDAGVEASVDAPTSTFCHSVTADFCADFDRGASPSADFDGGDLKGGGALTLVAGPSAMALHASIGPSTGEPPTAQVAKELTLGIKTQISVDLSMRVDATAPAPGQILRYLGWLIDNGSIGLFRDDKRWFISIHRDYEVSKDQDEIVPLPGALAEGWTKLHFELKLGTSELDGKVKVDVNGFAAIDATLATVGDAQRARSVNVIVGLAHAAGSIQSPFEADYDDVSVVLTP